VGLLTVPLTVTAGEADTFAPRDWLDLLARRAGAASRAVVLPGSHNNPFAHPELFGALVLEALDQPRDKALDQPRDKALDQPRDEALDSVDPR
jgi:pimeloyl-ACP methyl ester carboxylesterase